MKVTKTVDEQGKIEIKLEDLPQYPEGTRFHGPSFTLNQRSLSKISEWESVTEVDIGDFSCDFPYSINRACSSGYISECMQWNYDHVITAYNSFCRDHTNSTYTLTKEQVIEKLATEDRLLYRDKAGKFQSLNI